MPAGQEKVVEPGLSLASGSRAGKERLGGWQLSVPQSSLPLTGFQAVLCKGDHWRWNTGHCQGPQQWQRDTEKGRWPGEPLLTGQHWTLHPAAALPPGTPTTALPQGPCTHHISAVGHAGWWDWVVPLGLSGRTVIHGQCPIASWCSQDPGTQRLGQWKCLSATGELAEPEPRAASLPPRTRLPPSRPAALSHFLISFFLSLKETGSGATAATPSGRRKRML